MFNNFLSTPLPPYHNGLVKCQWANIKICSWPPTYIQHSMLYSTECKRYGRSQHNSMGPRLQTKTKYLFFISASHNPKLDNTTFFLTGHIEVSPYCFPPETSNKRRHKEAGIFKQKKSTNLLTSVTIYSRIRALVIIRENYQQNCTFLCFI